jgi:hypothetical protein
MAVHEWDQLEGDAKEREKLSADAESRSGFESHHQYDDHEMEYMDVRKFEEDAQEKEKMTESDEDDWDNDLEIDLDIDLGIDLEIDLEIDLDSDLGVELDNVSEESGLLQMDQHLW